MNHWVETPYGKRYEEDYGTSIAFFRTVPDEEGNRILPEKVIEVILKAYMKVDKWKDH